MGKSAPPLLEQLEKNLGSDEKLKRELIQKIKGIVVFNIDGENWTLDLRPGKGTLKKGDPAEEDKADITLSMTDQTFVSLVMGKLGPQQAFLMRKLKISGSMGLAMKDAAAPKSKM